MSQRRTTLARLHEELRNIQVFDRIHEYATDADPASERAYEVRQLTRKQIPDEIKRLKAARSEWRHNARVTSAVVFFCAFGYAMLYLLVK